MKTKYPSFLGLFAALLMVAAFVVPAHIAAPSAVSADPGIMKWDTVNTPAARPLSNDVVNEHRAGSSTGMGSEVLDMKAGSDGMRVVMIGRDWFSAAADGPVTAGISSLYPTIADNYTSMFYMSTNSGISISGARHLNLLRNNAWLQAPARNLFMVAIAPDDPNYIAVVSDNGSQIFNNPALITNGPNQIWVSSDAGQNWDLAFDGVGLFADESIKAIDISIDYGGRRDIAFGTVSTLAGGGRWCVRASTGFTTWMPQLNPNGVAAVAMGLATASSLAYQAIKFSPTYNGDSSVALVYSTDAAPAGGLLALSTYYNVAFRDLSSSNNVTLNYAFGNAGIEVRRPDTVPGNSPGTPTLNRAELELPSDFSGQSASLRRAYISLDAFNNGVAKAATSEDGIYRMDDTTVYTLMDTTNNANKSIYSIAYFGTYASGKLLAGERMGFPCTATVPTWFTDSPTTCPIPCWYPALKPTTGAANQPALCVLGTQNGVGAAIVAWNADGSLGYAATGSLPWTVYAGLAGSFGDKPELAGAIVASLADPARWWQALYWDAVNNDESAFAISRNNGETWNQIGMIDTTIDWFNDVVAAPDCTTIYLASVNRNMALGGYCNEFDSVWRSTINPNVAAPLPAVPPLGTYWERVYTRGTQGNCNLAQSDIPILRVVPSCTDKKDGEIVGWAAARAAATPGGTGGVMAWSPDFGDFWANVTPRDIIQDFTFESSTTLYTLSANGVVQRLPYTGTSWATNLSSADTVILFAHTIAAYPEGNVIVGAAAGAPYMLAFSKNKAETFSLISDVPPAGHGSQHVIFDVDFKDNKFIYSGDDAAGGVLGTVYRNTIPSFGRWIDGDMMSVANGAIGITWPIPPAPVGVDQPPHPIGIFGLVQAWTGQPQPALYAAHDNMTLGNSYSALTNSAVCRTLEPRNGMPKPGIVWDCLDIFAPMSQNNVRFTLEPTSLKYCGCCTLDTNTTLYAIDDERGVPARTMVLPAAGFGQWNGWRWPAVFGGPIAGYTPGLNQGMLWAYTDCLAKKGPVLKTPADKFLVGADPVTGRNQQIDLSWEQLCLATLYQLDIAKDKDFTLRVITDGLNQGAIGNAIPTPFALTPGVVGAQFQHILVAPAVVTSPATWIAPGFLPEAGAIYYWRIRVAQSATSQWAYSPWSEARSFTVKAGFIVNTPYYGVQLLAPNNGCLGCNVKPASFSWSPWKEATKYEFVLAKNSEMTTVVKQATTTTTGYEFDGTLDYSTNYFWRVRAIEVNGQAIPSDWSATFSFQTEGAPAPEKPAPAEPATPLWVWVIIAIGAILVIVTLILIFKTRRV